LRGSNSWCHTFGLGDRFITPAKPSEESVEIIARVGVDEQFFMTGRSQRLSVARPQAVIALQGLVPYNYEIEAEMFISHKGDVSGRFKATKDLLITQRLILQPRFETILAIQKVERFTTGRGLNNLELGLRLRYEIQR